MTKAPYNEGDIASTYIGVLSLTEIGLGSLLHASHVPFSGAILSLNQAFLLSHAVRIERARLLPAKISYGAALLKSLSPAGRRFRPMLAIAMQGWLYSLGLCLGGTNLFGRCLAGGLLSLWGFIQSALILGLIYGSLGAQLLLFYENLLAKTGLSLYSLLSVLVGIKALLAIASVIAASWLPDPLFNRYQNLLEEASRLAKPRNKEKSRWQGVWKDLTSPLFVGSLVLAAAFLYASVNDHVMIVLHLSRVLASALLAFMLIRFIPLPQASIEALGQKP